MTLSRARVRGGAGIALAAVSVLAAGARCSSTPSPKGCASNAECGASETCLFAIGSCSAPGQCLDVQTLGPECAHVVSYCGCDGTTVGGPCGPNYAYAPTLGQSGACGPTPTIAPGATLTTLAMMTQTGPEEIAIDATSVYFAGGGRVVKVAKAGGAPVILADGQDGPSGIAVDDTHVYWTNEGASGTVMKVPKSGGAPTVLASGQGAPVEIAVDDASVYWTNINGNHAVMKVGIDGGTPTVFAATTSPGSIAVRDGTVYFVDGDNIMMAPASGGSAVAIASGSAPDFLVVDGTNLYWSNGRQPGSVVKMPLAGGAPTTLVSPTGGDNRIAVDATNVYFDSPSATADSPNDGTVNRVPIEGGDVTVLVDGQSAPEGIAVDDTSVYWLQTYLGAAMKLTPK